MKKTAPFVVWICSQFAHQEIEQIIQGLFDVLANLNPEVKPKDDSKRNILIICSGSQNLDST